MERPPPERHSVEVSALGPEETPGLDMSDWPKQELDAMMSHVGQNKLVNTWHVAKIQLPGGELEVTLQADGAWDSVD